MINDQIQTVLENYGHAENLETRDIVLIRLLKQFETLTDSQKEQVLPQLKLTLNRHKTLKDSKKIIDKYLENLKITFYLKDK